MQRPLLALAVALALLAPPPAAAQERRPVSDRMGTDSAHHGRKGSGHRRAAHSRHGGLTRPQIRELQRALAREGCDPGGIDGRMGPRTHRATACARTAKGIGGSNPNELFRALGLSFTVADSLGMGGTMRPAAPAGMHGGAPRDTGHHEIIGRDSAAIFDSVRAKREGRGLKEHPRGRDTLPPGRTPR